ncbi:MAG: HAMP domain-containing sensor histidine kinase [Bacteroidia bacterium]
MTKQKIFSSLFWRISAILLLLLVVTGFTYAYISARSTQLYYQEANQRLNAKIAEHIVGDVSPFVNGEVNEEVVKELFHNIMVINPSVEVYLLDAQGNILTFFAPEKKIKIDQVPLGPMHEFIEAKGESFITGIDPRHPNTEKVFSAAPVVEDGRIIGYIYVILVSEEFVSVTDFLLGSYILRLGTFSMAIALVAALIIGLIAIWLITKYLNTIIQEVKRFQKGDYSARIPVKDNGELSQMAVAFNEMADTIVANIEELKKTHDLRKELIANVSHDLRTPLALMNGYIETLIIKQQSLTHEERKDYLDTVAQSMERMRSMVDELFELSKLEARQKLPQKEPFFINELVQDITQKYQLVAEEKRISIRPVLTKDLPPVYADVSMMERAIQNLLDNALKFSPTGGIITVELQRIRKGVEVRVSDNGPGIRQDEMPYIFDRYRSRSNHGSLDMMGTGLGLAIVSKILDLHDIKIEVKSSRNSGTSFIFNLPEYEKKGVMAK